MTSHQMTSKLFIPNDVYTSSIFPLEYFLRPDLLQPLTPLAHADLSYSNPVDIHLWETFLAPQKVLLPPAKVHGDKPDL